MLVAVSPTGWFTTDTGAAATVGTAVGGGACVAVGAGVAGAGGGTSLTDVSLTAEFGKVGGLVAVAVGCDTSIVVGDGGTGVGVGAASVGVAVGSTTDGAEMVGAGTVEGSVVVVSLGTD